MRSIRLLAPLGVLMLTPVFFMLNGCVVHERETVREPVPTEGYYDHEHHRWYHEHAWVACDDRDPHCPP